MLIDRAGREGTTRRRRLERGATLAEYALLLAVFVIPVGMGVSYLENGAKTKIGHVAEGVAESPTTTVPDPDAPTTTAAPVTTTTAAPTTTTPPTTTTAAPTTTTTRPPTTTTTAPPPTTAPPRPKSSIDDIDLDTDKTRDKTWKVKADVTIVDSNGKAVKDAKVTAKVEVYRNGRWRELDRSPITDTTNRRGKASFTVEDLDKDDDERVRVTVTKVEADDFDWDGNGVSDTASNPY